VNLAFTLCSNNYLAQARALGTSYLQWNPDDEFVIGLVDEYDPAVDYKAFGKIKVLSCGELGCPEFVGMQSIYDIVEFNTAVKPFYFEYFFKEGKTKAIYLDPDIIVYRHLGAIFELFDKSDILLTPHAISARYPNDLYWQQIFNAVGIYNLGFLGLAATENTMALLNWWKDRLKTLCRIIPRDGLFVDQIWANYFPALFDRVHIIKDAGCNMAPWNLGERKLTLAGDTFFSNGEPLKFYHFSNFKPTRPDVISRYTDTTFEERPEMKGLYERYVALLYQNGYKEYSALKPLLTFRQGPGRKQVFGRRLKFLGNRVVEAVTKKIFDA
jgi:hypothetical protein